MAITPGATAPKRLMVVACVLQAACTTLAPTSSQAPTPSAAPTAAAAAASTAAPELLQVSAACKAANLRAAAPLPVSALSEAVLRRAQSGWVAIRYDVLAGRAHNLRVVSSNPPGLYDDVVLRHAGTYTEPTGATVQGCIMTTHIRF